MSSRVRLNPKPQTPKPPNLKRNVRHSGLGFGVWGLGFGANGLGIMVWELGFRIEGSRQHGQKGFCHLATMRSPKKINFRLLRS